MRLWFLLVPGREKTRLSYTLHLELCSTEDLAVEQNSEWRTLLVSGGEASIRQPAKLTLFVVMLWLGCSVHIYRAYTVHFMSRGSVATVKVAGHKGSKLEQSLAAGLVMPSSFYAGGYSRSIFCSVFTKTLCLCAPCRLASMTQSQVILFLTAALLSMVLGQSNQTCQDIQPPGSAYSCQQQVW